MSQSIFPDINPALESGSQLAVDLNDFKAAILSGFSGASRPTEVVAGGYWVDDTNVPGFLVYYLYSGTDDVEVFRIDVANGTASATSATDLFTITKVSADAASPVLALIKKRIASSGQVLINDYVGTLQFSGNDNMGATPVTVRVRAIATNNYSSAAAGTDLIFEATPLGTSAIAEMMRLKDGKLGVGTTVPDVTIHAVGTGIKSQHLADDTTPAKFTTRKKKISGTGATLSGETFGVLELDSTDDAGTEVLAAKIEAIATETHSSTAHGTKVSVSVKKVGATSFTEQLSVGDSIQLKALAEFSDQIKLLQQVDSSTTGSAQSITPTKSFIKLTNASLTSVNNITNPADGKVVIIANGVGAPITLINNSGGTAANRIRTGTGADLLIANGAAVILSYDANSTLWQVVGGAGSGTPSATSLKWIERDNAPVSSVDTVGNQVYSFVSGEGQKMYAAIKVPSTWIPGSQIKLLGQFYSPDTSGTALVQSVATLIRTGTDAITSTTNQRTSTNSAITLSAANTPVLSTMDITDSTGKINSVSVSAGDVILVSITRGTDTATSDLSVMVNNSELTWS